MKSFLKKQLELILRFFTIRIIKKYQPEVIGITGSVGKTSTKEAVFVVLSEQFRVRKNIKNYNNEIGLPLTVIGVETGGRSLIKWIYVFLKAIRLIIITDKTYPEKLVLEMGIDKPGDMKYLVDMIPVKVGVFTAVSSTHVEFFKDIEHIAKEKGILIKSLPKDGLAVLNGDDKLVSETKSKSAVKMIGQKKDLDYQASQVSLVANGKPGGISFKLQYGGSNVPITLPNALGEQFVNAALIAVAVGDYYGLKIHDMIQALKGFTPPAGRMNLIRGIKHSYIIDDSYNSSPLAVEKALDTLKHLRGKGKEHRAFAVLGDMLELGTHTEEEHHKIGEEIAKHKIDYLITVGPASHETVKAAIDGGVDPSHCDSFDSSQEAGAYLQDKIKTGDVILVKGSQGMRTERVVKEIMAEPERAEELLVRQDKSWR